ncbi:ROK family transcriptional regulator, partial [Streptomyces boncukensis]
MGTVNGSGKVSGPVSQNDVRRHNAALVLGTIADAPGVSRADIAARTGLAKATVSMLVDRLRAAGLATETGRRPVAGRGRPATALTLSDSGPYGLGLEIGVDYLAVCRVDLTGRVRAYHEHPADNRAGSPSEVLGRAADLARVERTEAEAAGTALCGVGVAVPGLVETATGILRLAPNLGWQDVDTGAAFAARFRAPFPLPVSFANEADLAACAELWSGEHMDLRNFVYVSGEVGIGAGFVVNGRLFGGAHGFTGEIGHMCVDPGPQGARCRCGARGCLETAAGREAILRGAGLRE